MSRNLARALACAACIVVLLGAIGCSRDGRPEADETPSMKPSSAPVPDVIGMSESEAVAALDEALGAGRVVVFSATRHGSLTFQDIPTDPTEIPDEPTETAVEPTGTAVVTTSTPAPGEPAGQEVWIRVGPVPEGDLKGIKLGVGWFNHPPVAREKGADACMKCHEQKECNNCHLIVKRGGEARGGVAVEVQELAEEAFGKGSMSEPGTRGILLKSGNVFVAEVTVDPSWDASEAQEETRERTARFINAVLAKTTAEQVEWLQVAWFKPDSSLRVMEATYEHTAEWKPVDAQDLFGGVDFERIARP